MSTITAVDPIVVRIPFTDGSPKTGLFPTAWTHLDIVLVRVETDDGLVGWGEGFGYFCFDATAAMIRRSIAPILLGCDPADPRALGEEIQRKMVLPGRYGISTFALSGVDIALWDLAAKREGVSLARLLGGRAREEVDAYASLVRYGTEDLVARFCDEAQRDGYNAVKLHEITMPEIRTARRRLDPATRMVVDVNCNWSEAFTREAAPELMELDAWWLEEPVFPPEDVATLARLRSLGLPLASGENACTAVQFRQIVEAGAVDYLQPSITKVGGVSEFLKVRDLARESDEEFMLHSPYFGPGYLATLQLLALEGVGGLLEYLYVKPDAWLYPQSVLPSAGRAAIPDGPGLGFDPDPEVIERYRVEA